MNKVVQPRAEGNKQSHSWFCGDEGWRPYLRVVVISVRHLDVIQIKGGEGSAAPYEGDDSS